MKYQQHTYSCCGKTFRRFSWDDEKVLCECGKAAKKVKATKIQLHSIRTPTKNR